MMLNMRQKLTFRWACWVFVLFPEVCNPLPCCTRSWTLYFSDWCHLWTDLFPCLRVELLLTAGLAPLRSRPSSRRRIFSGSITANGYSCLLEESKQSQKSKLQDLFRVQFDFVLQVLILFIRSKAKDGHQFGIRFRFRSCEILANVRDPRNTDLILGHSRISTKE